jgi:hypothetical protein
MPYWAKASSLFGELAFVFLQWCGGGKTASESNLFLQMWDKLETYRSCLYCSSPFDLERLLQYSQQRDFEFADFYLWYKVDWFGILQETLVQFPFIVELLQKIGGHHYTAQYIDV